MMAHQKFQVGNEKELFPICKALPGELRRKFHESVRLDHDLKNCGYSYGESANEHQGGGFTNLIVLSFLNNTNYLFGECPGNESQYWDYADIFNMGDF